MQRPVPDEVLLGLIKAQPAHGYELQDRFKSKSDLGRIWTMSTSQLYAVLKRLEDEELILGKKVAVKDAPSRNEYSITERGERKLMSWMNEENPSSSIHRMRVIFMSKLYIAILLCMPFDDVIAHQKISCATQKMELIKERTQVQSQMEGLVLDFVISQLDSALSWLDNCTRTLHPHPEC